MKILRHKIDGAFMSGVALRASQAFEDLPRFVGGSRRTPRNFGNLLSEALAAAAFEHLVDPASPRINDALLLAAQASSALFACAMNPAGPVTVQLGEGEPVTYASGPDESWVNVTEWLDGFFLNVICGDIESVQRLCQIPNDLLLRSSTKGSEYLYLYKDALCAYVNQTDRIIESIMAALDATDPGRPDIFDAFSTLSLTVPQLEVFARLISSEVEYSDSIRRAVQKHQDYWSKPQSRARDFRGFISIRLLGLAALGRDAGLSFDVETPYLPMDLVRL